jgi:hypothetical protein
LGVLLVSGTLAELLPTVLARMPDRPAIYVEQLAALHRERREVAASLFQHCMEQYERSSRPVTVQQVHAAAERLLESELALCQKDRDRIAVYQRYRDAMDKLRRQYKDHFDRGRIADPHPQIDVHYFAIDADVKLYEARRLWGER